MLKICFVGVGSIGTRHIRNLVKLFGDRTEFVIDAIRTRGNALPDDIAGLLRDVYCCIEDAPSDYDIFFVTNPTSLHYKTIKSVSKHTKHMFIEKPVFAKPVDGVEDLQLKEDSVYYVAAPMRYGAVITKLKELIEKETIYSVRAISSSYLPEWREGVDYRDNYSAHKDMGGGVALDIIHEIDYLTYLFGMPQEVKCYGGKYSELQIDSDDLAIYMLKYPDKLVEVHLDYFGRRTVREVELYCEEYTIVGDFVTNTIKYVYSDYEQYIELPENQDYENELTNFFKVIKGMVDNENDIEHANNVLRIALGEWPR